MKGLRSRFKYRMHQL